MKMIRVIKASNVDDRIRKVVDNNLYYEQYSDKGMVNPSPLLKKYEDMYEGIRPKDIDFGTDAGDDGYIRYISQGCEDTDAMFNMIYEAISKDRELKKMYDEGHFKIQVCDRDHWGQWTTFTNNEKEEFDLDQLIEDAEYAAEFDDDFIFELAEELDLDYMKYDTIEKLIRANPEKAEKFIRQHIN